MEAISDEKIDFVITWVDDQDARWRKEKSRYCATESSGDDISRFRSWDNLIYWFRGVEKFAPWVNRIHFITFGHLPHWLDTGHPKLNIVRHEDFIPAECLPTFSSRPIEFYIHKIENLGDKFVYFNDDMFIVSKVSKKYFFCNGKPCDEALLKTFYPNDDYSQIIFNNLKLINKHFMKREAVIRNLNKWINYRYGLKVCVDNVLQLMNNKNDFSSFENTHLPVAYTKSQFEAVWNSLGESLYETCKRKFRTRDDVNHYLIRYWRLAKGDFHPRKMPGVYFGLSNMEECLDAADAIAKKKNRMVCINDVPSSADYDEMKNIINEAFNIVFPHKSEFEI